MEVWITHKYGREDYYSSIQNRLEFEIGLTQRLQTAFYLNLNASTSPVTFVAPTIDSTGELIFEERSDLRTTFDVGFSNEWKYQLTSPVTNKIGSALYGEITIFPNEFELEGKLILDKKFNRVTTALNLVGEIEWEAEHEEEENETEWEKESKFEIDYGIVYSINNHWNIGFEARNNNVIEPEGEWEHSALFLGPTFSYKQDNWWLVLAVQPQVTDLKGGGLSLQEHEKLNSRLLFSYSF